MSLVALFLLSSVMLRRIDNAVEKVNTNAMLKAVLCGKLPQGARKDLEMFKKHLDERFWFVKVKDMTGIELRAEDYVNDGDDVVKAADAAADRMTAIFTALIERL